MNRLRSRTRTPSSGPGCGPSPGCRVGSPTRLTGCRRRCSPSDRARAGSGGRVVAERARDQVIAVPAPRDGDPSARCRRGRHEAAMPGDVTTWTSPRSRATDRAGPAVEQSRQIVAVRGKQGDRRDASKANRAVDDDAADRPRRRATPRIGSAGRDARRTGDGGTRRSRRIGSSSRRREAARAARPARPRSARVAPGSGGATGTTTDDVIGPRTS